MRALFLLLVLANLLFFAYALVTRDGGDIAALIPQLEMAPEKIKLLKSTNKLPAEKPKGQGKAIPPSARTAGPPPAACLEWGNFVGPAVAKAEGALARVGIAADQFERSVADSGGYWVHMPPMKTKAEVDKKVGELKSLGVTEFFVVGEAGQWRNAISLGIFRSEEAAQAFLAQLKERGVRSAVAARRENFLKHVVLHVRDPNPGLVATLTELQKEFPGSEMRAGPCPTFTAAAKG
jgi:hypothetical protein